MSDEHKVNVSGGWGGFWVMVAILSVFFNGEPDLVTALIHYLMSEPPQ